MAGRDLSTRGGGLDQDVAMVREKGMVWREMWEVEAGMWGAWCLGFGTWDKRSRG